MWLSEFLKNDIRSGEISILSAAIQPVHDKDDIQMHIFYIPDPFFYSL